MVVGSSLAQRWRGTAGLASMVLVVVSIIAVFVVLDIASTVTQSKRELVATSRAHLTEIRDRFLAASPSRTFESWDALNDRLSGSGPLRILLHAPVLPLSRKLGTYDFTHAGCRRFESLEASSLTACALYNDESRQLQLAAAWPEHDWAPVLAGDVDPAKGDRIRIRIPGVLDEEIVASPQGSRGMAKTFEQCVSEWRSEASTRRCDHLAVSVFSINPKTRLLNAEVSDANGTAIRTARCPGGLAGPCIRMLVNVSMPPPPVAGTQVCMTRHDANSRLDRAAEVSSSCDDRGEPLMGRYVGIYSVPPSSVAACEEPGPCVCASDRAPDATCHGLLAGVAAEEVVFRSGQGVVTRAASWASRLATHFVPLDVTHAAIPVLSEHATPVAYFSSRVGNDHAIDLANPVLAPRLPLYLVALLTPIILGIGMARVFSNYKARTEAEQRANEAHLQQQLANAELIDEINRRSLADAALASATRGLEDLGHELLSPAQSLSLIAKAVNETFAGTDDAARLRETYFDHIDGYVRRIMNAATRVSAGLLMQRRQATAVSEKRRVVLGPLLHRRLKLEQKVAPLPFDFNDESDGAAIAADAGDLEEIIGNLLGNARRFASGQPIRVSLKSERTSLRVIFANDGPIIERGEEEAIFAAGKSLSPADDGVSHGLGLFLCRNTVAAMGGTIEARNEPEPATHGVAFILTFPIAEQTPTENISNS